MILNEPFVPIKPTLEKGYARRTIDSLGGCWVRRPHDVWLIAHVASQTGGPTDASVSVTGGIGNQTTVDPTITWEDPGFAVDRYDLYINPLGARSTVTYRRSNLTSTSHKVETSLADGEYEVWLRAFYSNGTVSRWGSDPTRLLVSAGQTSDGPPRILSPGADAPTARPEFAWTATTGAVSYEIWISDQATLAPLIREVNIVGNSFTPTSDFAAGSYRVWVRAKLMDSTTNWSAVSQFTIGSGRPSLTVINGVAIWPAVSGASRYELWVDQFDDDGNRIEQRIYHSNLHIESDVNLNPVLPAGNFGAWLRVIHYDGETTTLSPWSAKASFTLS